MRLAERQELSSPRRAHFTDVDEVIDLICSGEVRDALRTLMRSVPDELERSRSNAAASDRVPACLTGLCYALMGMYSDAAEWCETDKCAKGEARDADNDEAKRSCLRLWYLVAEGDLRPAMSQCLAFFALKDLSHDVLYCGVAGTVLLALKLEDHALARDVASLVPEQTAEDLPHLGAALIEVCRLELGFRDILHAMPEFRGTVGSIEDFRARPVLDRLNLASRAETLAAHIERLEKRLCRWPLLQEFTLTMRLGSESLAQQFLDRAADLSCLEIRIGSFNTRGLAPLYRYGRFLLALLNLHQGRPATAQSWLATERPSEHETREHLLAANLRVYTQNWSHAFTLYQHYVNTAAGHGRIAGELRARIAQAFAPQCVPSPFQERAQRSHGVPREALQANESRFVKKARQSQLMPMRATTGTQTADAIRDLIEEDLGQPLLVREIAARLGIARRTVENRVRIESGHSVKRFVTALRLEHAYRLVQESAPVNAHTLQAIAAQVGFSSYRTFCAAYTKSFGRIPHRRGRP